jgi:hypothetical protein
LEDDRVVTKEQAQTLAASWGANYYETSARKKINVDQVFHDLVREINRKAPEVRYGMIMEKSS